MSIIRETKWALLELFPEQKETEAEAEEAARAKILADAKAEEEARLQAEAEAAAKTAATAGEDTPKEEPARKKSVIDQVAEEMAAIDLTPKKPEEQAAAVAETEPQDEAEAEAAVSEPEDDDPPVSLEPEGERPFGVLIRDYTGAGIHIDVFCAPDKVVDAARILDGNGFTLEAVTGVDWIKEEEMEVVYDYNRTDGPLCRVAVRTRVPRAEPEVPTISEVFPGANWHERETHEFFGIRFSGHPNLVPLLLPEDADFHPLLKDFQP